MKRIFNFIFTLLALSLLVDRVSANTSNMCSALFVSHQNSARLFKNEAEFRRAYSERVEDLGIELVESYKEVLDVYFKAKIQSKNPYHFYDIKLESNQLLTLSELNYGEIRSIIPDWRNHPQLKSNLFMRKLYSYALNLSKYDALQQDKASANDVLQRVSTYVNSEFGIKNSQMSDFEFSLYVNHGQTVDHESMQMGRFIFRNKIQQYIKTK